MQKRLPWRCKQQVCCERYSLTLPAKSVGSLHIFVLNNSCNTKLFPPPKVLKLIALNECILMPGSLLNTAGMFGLPVIGIVGSLIKVGGNVLNPDVKLADLKRTADIFFGYLSAYFKASVAPQEPPIITNFLTFKKSLIFSISSTKFSVLLPLSDL